MRCERVNVRSSVPFRRVTDAAGLFGHYIGSDALGAAVGASRAAVDAGLSRDVTGAAMAEDGLEVNVKDTA